MGYIELWEAAEVYDVFMEPDRAHCDGLITGGKVSQDLILDCLKTMVRLDLTQKFGLNYRVYDPTDRPYLKSTH